MAEFKKSLNAAHVLAEMRKAWNDSPEMLIKVYAAIIEPMVNRYYSPVSASNESEYLQRSAMAAIDYVKFLGTFSQTVLESAWLNGIKAHKTQRWPSLGVFAEAAEKLIGPGAKTIIADPVREPTRDERAILNEMGWEWRRSVTNKGMQFVQRQVNLQRDRNAAHQRVLLEDHPRPLSSGNFGEDVDRASGGGGNRIN